MADGHTDINCSITIQKLNNTASTYDADISKYTETSLTRVINYTKVIGGLILPRPETGVSKEVSFEFISNDLKFEGLFDSSIVDGTAIYTPNANPANVFEIGDNIIGDVSGATATITNIVEEPSDVWTMSLTNIVGNFNVNEVISQDGGDGAGTLVGTITVITASSQTVWDTFDLFKISLLFTNGDETHKRIFYNCYIVDYESKIEEGVLAGMIKFSFPLKNINGDSNFYVYNSDTDNDGIMKY